MVVKTTQYSNGTFDLPCCFTNCCVGDPLVAQIHFISTTYAFEITICDFKRRGARGKKFLHLRANFSASHRRESNRKLSVRRIPRFQRLKASRGSSKAARGSPPHPRRRSSRL